MLSLFFAAVYFIAWVIAIIDVAGEYNDNDINF